ncbi:hypothetical protein [Rhodopseudomonas sp. BR0M22]|uniref:hypothetical protein n=1 Tax=Rhodopseudomonas sp. BR0M22 TaxID=2269369 RepID=UPI0013E06EB3|nr:hypothetical protein [Rhodopseudomonas sp. BR0M22]NEW93875.1 hypothetical protein [Rhodopseudomonas sp. BR0M22]
MLELGLIGMIGLALLYCAVLWWVSRHRDVLYGDFVSPAEVIAAVDRIDAPRRPAALPAIAQHTSAAPTAANAGATQPAAPVQASQVQMQPSSAGSEPAVSGPRTSGAHTSGAHTREPTRLLALFGREQSPPTDTAHTPQQHQDVLASLLETIKRDLSGAVSKP